MLRHSLHVFLFVFAFIGSVFSQIAKGDKFYEKAEYVKAIPYYKKESRSNSSRKQEAFIKLGNSYKLMNNYADAEDAYRKAMVVDSVGTAELYYNYAQVLKANNKYTEAAQQYKNYIKLSPNDENAKNALRFCNEIKYYLSMPIEYTVKNIESINTNKAEFSPFITNNKLMFVAERESFDFINYNLNEYNGEPYLNMYISNIENSEIKKSKTFSKKLNNEFHDGPACVSTDGKTLYFTRVDYKEQKGFVNNAKIFTATVSERDWKNIHPVEELNSDNYSVAHPSISSDNKTLFFTSNMPGGYGGKDIYMSERSSDSSAWGKPVNLGPDVNTSGDEMFPSIRKDGTLFFSSSGLPGYGGLDIYTAKKFDSRWLLVRNEGLDINSSGDDFGITFLNDSVGYFSSNRTGGKGKDDIYWYRYKTRIVVIDGTVLMTQNMKDYAKMKKVYLLDEKGNIVDSTQTDGKGYFAFKNLDGEKKYMAAVDDSDPEFSGKARFYLAEGKDTVIHRVTQRMGKNKFAFKNLPIEAGSLPDMSTEDNMALSGNLLYGNGKALKNAKLKLVSDKGDVMEEVTTNESGAFVFRNIPPDQNYMISIEETDVALPAGTKVMLTNRAGKELKSFIAPGGKNKFNFKLLATDKAVMDGMEADDMNIVMDIYGYMYDQDKKPLSNTKIRVREDNGTNEQTLQTNEKGRFSFKNLAANKNYIFETDEGDPSLVGVKRIYIADNKGKIYKIVDFEGGKFSFKILEVDKTAMGEFAVDDALAMKIKDKKGKKEEDLKTAEMDIFGYMYNQDKKPLANTKIKMREENGAGEQTLQTNDKGRFNFKNLSASKNYIFEADASDPSLAGVKRIYIADNNGKIYKIVDFEGGKFSFKILDVDKVAMGDFVVDDPVVKTKLKEQLKQKVRVMEAKKEEAKLDSMNVDMDIFGYMYNQDKKPLVNTKIRMREEDGSNEQLLQTNEKGRFNFKNLSSNKNYIFETDANDPSLIGIKRIYIADNNGKIYKIVDFEGGKFSFKILDVDKVAMGDFEVDDPVVKTKLKERLKQKVKVMEAQKDEAKLDSTEMGIFGYMYNQDKKPLVNTKIRMLEEDGSGEQLLKTDDKGRFNFKNLSANKNYIFETDANDPSLVGVKRIYIADNKGKIYKIVDFEGGKFSFKILDVDKAVLGDFVVDDPVVNMKLKERLKERAKVVQPEPEPEVEFDPSLTIVENIYYAYGDFHINAEGELILNKAAEILSANPKFKMEINSHTDSHSSAGFNLKLSQKRAQTAVDFLVSKGIGRTRMIARGYGETRLLNKCADGVECSDDEHKINRRTEFKITNPRKK